MFEGSLISNCCRDFVLAALSIDELAAACKLHLPSRGKEDSEGGQLQRSRERQPGTTPLLAGLASSRYTTQDDFSVSLS